jgi:hypothetical protein
MRTTIGAAVFGIVLSAVSIVHAVPVVDEVYPYTGPDVPIGDWVDNTINGNGKGFPRLVEPPAVTPKSKNPTNNINVISLSYLPGGINIHYQTPFGLGVAPLVTWGILPFWLNKKSTGSTHRYVQVPNCLKMAYFRDSTMAIVHMMGLNLNLCFNN